MNDEQDFPFWEEWEQQQAEPLPDFGKQFPEKRSPLAIDRLPDLKTETLFDKENDNK